MKIIKEIGKFYFVPEFEKEYSISNPSTIQLPEAIEMAAEDLETNDLPFFIIEVKKALLFLEEQILLELADAPAQTTD